MNVFKKLWVGFYSLPIAFWGFYVCGYFIGRYLVFLLSVWLLKSVPGLRPSVVVILAQTLDVAYLVVASVGVWRSASNFRLGPKLSLGLHSGYNFGWGAVAKCAVFGWGLKYVFYLANGGASRLVQSVIRP